MNKVTINTLELYWIPIF